MDYDLAKANQDSIEQLSRAFFTVGQAAKGAGADQSLLDLLNRGRQEAEGLKKRTTNPEGMSPIIDNHNVRVYWEALNELMPDLRTSASEHGCSIATIETSYSSIENAVNAASGKDTQNTRA